MKETETELAPSITAILFNEIDSKRLIWMCLGLLAGSQSILIKG
jgi:hypothetical protein